MVACSDGLFRSDPYVIGKRKARIDLTDENDNNDVSGENVAFLFKIPFSDHIARSHVKRWHLKNLLSL
jgi:hypothetical protein